MNNKGITLISLIVTIVAIIIIAGVTLNIALGENGILNKTKQAVDTYKNAYISEQETLNSVDAELENLFDGVSGLVNARSIAENPSAYYGKVVTNYTCTNSAAVANWKIFHSDGTNIYLIADDYIHFDYAPTGRNGTELYINSADNGQEEGYKLSFNDIINNYTGAEDITDARITKWLNYLNEYPTSTNNNMKAVAFMLDSSRWSNFAGTNAEYAIGGPTLDMFVASYNATHSSKQINYKVDTEGNGYGYMIKWSTDADYDPDEAYYIEGLNTTEMDNLYVIDSNTKAYAMWLAGPSCNDYDYMFYVNYGGNIYGDSSYDLRSPGLRPLVCLKSNVKLTTSNNGTSYQISE